MTVSLTGSGHLMRLLALTVDVARALVTHHGTTVPGLVDTVLADMDDLDDTETSRFVAPLQRRMRSYRDAATLQSALKTYAGQLIVDRVTADAPQVRTNPGDCLAELIRQMDAGSETVKRNTVGGGVSGGGGDAPTVTLTTIGGDGTPREGAIDETLIGTRRTDRSLRITSGTAQGNRLAHDWPKGSGIDARVSIATAGRLANHSFDQETTQTHVPDNWLVETGKPGTTLEVTETEVQRITFSAGGSSSSSSSSSSDSTISSGRWSIRFTNKDGDTQQTSPLVWNATASAVQTALRALDGCGDIVVTKSGYTYTVTFNDVVPAGDQPLLAITHTFATATFTVAEDVAGEPAVEWRSLAILGDDTGELTAIKQPLHTRNLNAETVYAWSLQARIDAGTTGTLVVELVDGAGDVVTDSAGTANRTSIDLSTLSEDWAAQTGWFRLPADVPEVYYVRLRMGASLSVGEGVYLDDFILTAATSLYTGGPLVGVFWNGRDPRDDDRYTLSVTNDWAGTLQTWFWRWFGRLLPSAGGGAHTISDAGLAHSSSSSSSSSG